MVGQLGALYVRCYRKDHANTVDMPQSFICITYDLLDVVVISC